LKILASLGTISALLMLFPVIYSEYADRMFHIAYSLIR
jgi:hypothetical protein